MKHIFVLKIPYNQSFKYLVLYSIIWQQFGSNFRSSIMSWWTTGKPRNFPLLHWTASTVSHLTTRGHRPPCSIWCCKHHFVTIIAWSSTRAAWIMICWRDITLIKLIEINCNHAIEKYVSILNWILL